MPDTSLLAAWRANPMRTLAAATLLAGWQGFAAVPAFADLKLCNSTVGRIGVAIGYEVSGGLTSEGWWTIPGETCETLLKGKLNSRLYYIHAIDYDRGGEWTGEMEFCIADKPFTIKGNADCEKRGHNKSGFLEVDTQGQRDWTIRLTDPDDTQKSK
jgi:uncharacterized membrane protein